MFKIIKYNEFIDNELSIILNLIKESEDINLPDLELISQTESYRKVVSYGKKVIPLLLERNSIIWDRALSEITGNGLSPIDYNVKERLNYWKNWANQNGY